MINIMTSNNVKNESTINGKDVDISEECSNLIWTMKAIDYINEENQENLSRVHVLCCNQCEFLTISLKILQQHMTIQHNLLNDDFDNITIYSCQECKCVSTELKLIQEHIKIFHKVSSENTDVPEKVPKVTSILTPSLAKNTRKVATNIKLVKTQLKIRKKILQRKSLKMRVSGDFDLETSNKNHTNSMVRPKENSAHSDRAEMSQDVNENDPLDMSMNSITCPFKGVKCENMDSSNFAYSTKQDAIVNEAFDQLNNNGNPLLTNPQTCIELIKLTLNQMLSKNTEQNRLSHIGFNPAFLQPQFQLSPNVVPLLLQNASQLNNNNPQTNSDGGFLSKNPEIEAILANFQQQNIFKSSSPKSFEQTNQIVGYQPSPIYLNHNSGSGANVTKALFIDNGQKNGNLNISPLSVYTAKKSTDVQTRTSNKRNLKKQSAPTKIRNGLAEELEYIQGTKFESPKTEPANHENLFNRSFLDICELDTGNDRIPLTKPLEEQDTIDSQINHSCKSSPNTLTNDKPHRQNFTSQQNRILSDWFFTHCDKPYPSTEDTKELSQLSGLTYSQVKKWFANKRARSSLNKKNHKNFCMITTAESTMDEPTNNDMLSISPSSESNKSYTNQIDTTEAIDFTKINPDDFEQTPQLN